MKKIMFNNKYLLTRLVLTERKTMTRRVLKGNTQKHLPYKIGDVVAIAQSYKDIYAEKIADFAKHNYHIPREDAAEKFRKLHETCAGWNNKMFVRAELMPHHIIITDVKVERLQEISDEDCIKDGVRSFEGHEIAIRHGLKEHYTILNTFYVFDTPHEAYAKLIDKISGKGTWGSNPWVVAYSFELVD